LISDALEVSGTSVEDDGDNDAIDGYCFTENDTIEVI
jgi:hypothetical protein